LAVIVVPPEVVIVAVVDGPALLAVVVPWV
jgi:hypothetical protein